MIRLPRLDAARLVGWPRALGLAEYERAERAFLDAVANVPGVRSIHRFGTVGFPGVSDIDFFVVADPSELAPNAARWRDALASIQGMDRYLALAHDPFLLDARAFRGQVLVRPTARPELLWGPPAEIATPALDGAFHQLRAWELVAGYYPDALLAPFRTAAPHVRYHLQVLNAFRHTYAEQKLAFGAVASVEDWIAAFLKERPRFLSDEPRDALADLLTELHKGALAALADMIAMPEAQRAPPGLRRRLPRAHAPTGKLFVDDWSRERFELALERGLRRSIAVTPFPRAFASPIAADRDARGALWQERRAAIDSTIAFANALPFRVNAYVPYCREHEIRAEMSPRRRARRALARLATAAARLRRA